MPQTSPMNWIIISILLLIMINLINNPMSSLKKNKNQKTLFIQNKNMTWKW